MFEQNISKEDINELPLQRYEGEIVLIDQTEAIQAAFQEIKQYPIVGFDTETKPVFVKGEYNDVALLQIAIPKKTFLIRINKTGITYPIVDFFERKDQKKIGVGLKDDIIALQKMHAFDPFGFLELNEIVNEIGIEANGLRKLTAIILEFRISKNAQVSNWEARELSFKQKTYAATDAWVCLEMYQKLCSLSLIKSA